MTLRWAAPLLLVLLPMDARANQEGSPPVPPPSPELLRGPPAIPAPVSMHPRIVLRDEFGVYRETSVI